MYRVQLGILPAFALGCAFAQSVSKPPAFEIASVKPSKYMAGRDGNVTTEPARFTATHATLKRLILEAYDVPYSRITGGPPWLDSNEFDIDAKAERPASPEQLKLMLRTLLTERFKLVVRRESKEGRVYMLLAGKNGAHLQASGDDARRWRFHGDLNHFADILAVQLTIPFLDDPTTPSHARGAPIPVMNKTGIEGVYDIGVDLKPEAGADPFTVWQRALQEQLGLRLEAQKAPIEFLVVESAEKIPTEN